jgi:hypothetical protein
MAGLFPACFVADRGRERAVKSFSFNLREI